MRKAVFFGMTAALVCVPAASGELGQKCVRWIALGTVSMSALVVAPPIDPIPRTTTAMLRPPRQDAPWREFRYDGLSKRFFEGTPGHRSAARVVNRAALDDQTDEKLRTRMDGDAEFLTLDLRSIVMRRRDEGVQVGWVTSTQEIVFPKRVSVEDLESGERVALTGTFLQKGRLGEARGTMRLVLRLDLRTQRLAIEEATCKFAVASLLGTVEDEAALGPADAAEGAGERLPQRLLD